jgi:hypothetical protein
LHEKAKPKEIVIPSLPNKDFRKDAVTKRSIYIPEAGLNGGKNAGPSQPEVLGQQVAQYGLQVTKKTKETVTVEENGSSSEMQIEESTTVTEPTQTLEEAALAALVRGKSRFDKDGGRAEGIQHRIGAQAGQILELSGTRERRREANGLTHDCI